ncbi:hypothetical protein D7V92_18195 [Parabacteroides sp. CH2-D42-20]|nr:hypothetical protein D7V92_18195 [Parabacteroides sp. CH2-D42-20]
MSLLFIGMILDLISTYSGYFIAYSLLLKIFTTLFYVDICEKRLAFLILPIWLINNISQIQYIYYRILIDLNLYDNFFFI